jgi:DNA polymerase III epsilon subunit-like protein
MTDWTSLDYAVVDVEGNGQQPPDLVELAVVPIRSGAIGEPVTWLVRPAEPISRLATRIHGLRNQDVAGAPAFADISAQVATALAAPVLVAHNAHVDIGVLARKLPGWQPPEVLDTLRLARRLLPGLPSYRLGALAGTLGLSDGLPAGLSPHRAAYDALVTARLFAELATRTPALEELRGSPPGKAGKDAAALF